MKKFKIFSALDHLDTYELNRFEKFVNSPYFNGNQGLINICELYISKRKKESKDQITKDELWESAFKGKVFSDSRLRKALSDLLKLYEDFLCQELLEKKPIQRATMLMEALEEKNIEELYNTSIKRASQLSNENQGASARMHFHRYEIERNFYELTDFDIKRNEKSNISNIIKNLDHFYLAEKLKYYCTSISRSTFVDHQYDYLFIEEIKNHIQNHRYEGIPIVNIWINIFFLQTGESKDLDQNFQEYRESFARIIGDVPQKEASQIYTYGQNYCIKQINNGSEKHFQDLFDLNKQALAASILFEKKNLDPWVFRNFVTVAMRLNEFEWTSSFINDYGKYIADSFRGNAVNYSKALLAFYQGNYNEVLKDMNQMDILDLSYELNTRSLLILTYYEMDEIDALSSLLDSFYVYLNRHKDISIGRRELYLQMISFTRRLLNTLPSDKKAHEKMLAKLEETKGIASGAWLKEKILERLN